MARKDSSTLDSVARRDFLKTSGAGGAVLAAGLAGCAGQPESGNGGGTGGGAQNTGNGGTSGSTGKPTLNIWLSYITEGQTKKQYTKKVLDEFQSKTGITINLRGVPYTDIVKKFRAARASGDVPHLIEVMTRPSVLAGDVGMVVNDLFQSMELSDKASEKVMKGNRVWGAQATGKKGNLITMPLGFRPYLSCWRTDWLEQAGIPKERVNYEAGSLNWYDDIPGIYDKLKQTKLGQKKGYFPDTTGMKQSDEEYLSLYIPQHGGSKSGVVNLKGNKGTLDTKAARDAIKMQKDYVEKGYFDSNSINNGDEESTTMHWAGKLAVNHMQDSTDLWSSYWEEQPKAMENGMYTWGPPMNAGTQSALAWLPSLGFVKSAFGGQAEKDAAAKLIDWWVADKQRATQNAKKLGFVPVFPNAIQKQDYFGKTQVHKEFWRGACVYTLKNFESAVIPAVKGGNKVTYEIPRRMHVRVMQQGMDIEKSTRMANKEINQVLQGN